MKFLITTQRVNDQGDMTVAYVQSLPLESDNMKHHLVHVDYLPDKEGYHQELIYDNLAEAFKFVYVRDPLTEEEKVAEKVDELEKRALSAEKALQDILVLISGIEEDEGSSEEASAKAPTDPPVDAGTEEQEEP